MKPHRIVSLDLIRTVAILLVIMQHSWSGLHLDDPSLGIGCHSYQALVVLGVRPSVLYALRCPVAWRWAAVYRNFPR